MADTIVITNPHTIAIIEQEAAERGLSPSEAVDRIVADRHAVPSMPERGHPTPRGQESPEARAARLARAHELIREMQAMMTDEDRAFDYDAWLYDENGLPH